MKYLRTLLILSFALSLVITYVSAGERSDHKCGPAVGNPPCGNNRCCSVHNWCGGGSSYCGKGNCRYQCWSAATTSSNVPPRAQLRDANLVSNNAISKIISESLFDEMFKHRRHCPSQGFYSYEAFITAAASFPGFGTTGDVATRKRELAAFLAQTSQATTGHEWSDAADSHAWGYCHINGTTSENDYCTSSHWPCASGKTYNSRGPVQLIYNSNYGLAGEALGLDLINDPDLVATDPVVSFKTAVWFWMTQHDNKPSCHDILINANSKTGQVPSYGVIGNIINGVHNVIGGSSIGSIGYYKRYCDMLEVSYGDDLKYWYDQTLYSEDAHIQMPIF
ncbi:Glycoside hydrolase [Trema orientale]|uniref:Glycoside hydrolase n=1 Tax=Trema orientale TaxID=63057 RepID=A0A2P5EQB9_TREOI|nr:Glycoside hydrolase [Trema orientale]